MICRPIVYCTIVGLHTNNILDTDVMLDSGLKHNDTINIMLRNIIQHSLLCTLISNA